MEKITVTSLAEWTAASAAAILAGEIYSISTCGMPAINTVKDTRVAQHTVKEVFKNGRKHVFPLVLLGSSSALLAWYRSTSSDFRWLYLAGAGSIFSIIPFSFLTMTPDANAFKDDDLVVQKGEKWVRDTIQSQRRRQLVEALLAVLGSDLCFIGMLLSR